MKPARFAKRNATYQQEINSDIWNFQQKKPSPKYSATAFFKNYKILL